MALPMLLLCLDMAAWNAADVAEARSQNLTWNWLDHAFASLMPALILRFVLTFLGRDRELRSLQATAYLYFGTLSLVCLSAIFFAQARLFSGSTLWGWIFVLGFASLMSLCALMLWKHLARSTDPLERARTRLIIVALVTGAALGPTEIAQTLGVGDLPRLGNLASLFAALILGLVTLRLELLDRALPRIVLAETALLTALAVVAYVLIFQRLSGSIAAYTAGTLTVTLAMLAALRPPWTAMSEQRAAARELQTLGRFSIQMAHDLGNPLAALQGAAQLLAAEPLEADHQRYVALIEAQAKRMSATIDRYRRLSRVELRLAQVDLNALVEQTVGSLPPADRERIELDLSPQLTECGADPALICAALENLLSNALQAIDAQGTVWVTTSSVRTSGVPQVRICVQDDGPGIDPRTRARAFEEFFTTKSSGSGLGLAFVKRIAEAHHGQARLESAQGGCRATLQWPLS